jgi:hypothetical protein
MKIIITESQLQFIRRYQEIKDWVRFNYNYFLDVGFTDNLKEITIEHSATTFLGDPDTQIEWTEETWGMLRGFIENNFEDLIS